MMTDTRTIPEDRRAASGKIWQCQACGKRAEDRYGIIGWSDYDYDESCMMNAVQVEDTREEGVAS